MKEIKIEKTLFSKEKGWTDGLSNRFLFYSVYFVLIISFWFFMPRVLFSEETIRAFASRNDWNIILIICSVIVTFLIPISHCLFSLVKVQEEREENIKKIKNINSGEYVEALDRGLNPILGVDVEIQKKFITYDKRLYLKKE